MLFVDNQGINDPHVNLAIEEYLLRHVEVVEPLLLFYINEPSVIIGRNQNTIEEIDPNYVAANGVHVVRRLSGGGAVYHDLGNLNFSFITQGREDLHNFTKFTKPVITVLHELGVEAELRGRSDIFAGGKKVSGNAQYVAKTRMLSHGTLLFDSELMNMLQALNPRRVKVESKAVQSVRNFVNNVRELLPDDMDIHQFRERVLHGIFATEDVPTYDLTEAAWTKIEEIANNRYRLWDWNYGRSPQFNVQKTTVLTIGKVDARIYVDEARIQGVRFYGNFTSKQDVSELEAILIGVRYDRQAIEEALDKVDITPYFGEMERLDFIDLLY